MNTDEKLKELRSRWLKEPANRKIIEVQAKLLLKGRKVGQGSLYDQAKEIFKV